MAKLKIILAPVGISNLKAIINPNRLPTMLIAIDQLMIWLNFLTNKLAADGGIVNKESTRIIPITFMDSTMVIAIIAPITYFIFWTGNFVIFENSGSKAVYKIGS